MGPRQRVDAVDLNEAQPVDQIGQRRTFRGTGRRLKQRVTMQEQPPRRRVFQFWEAHFPDHAIIRANNRTRLTDPPASKAA